MHACLFVCVCGLLWPGFSGLGFVFGLGWFGFVVCFVLRVDVSVFVMHELDTAVLVVFCS